MFKKVLIANRGEIALRIMRTLRKMGIRSVAVYSGPDQNLAFVREADEAVSLGGQRALDSYLVVEKILEAARETGADALHPGYGFLSENASFARSVAQAGITFIGPSPESIALMGDKERARECMAKVGFPTLPAFSLEGLGEAQIISQAESIGFPVLVKARFGGGGIGMGIVQDAQKLLKTIVKVQDAAARNFGKGHVYVEKYLKNAKHIEFQVAGDVSGQVLCLGVRECSVQRRHQKLIEESPSPIQGKDPEGFGKIQLQVTQALEKIGYSNLGTVETLACEGQFYFLEMNTRLQVEHRVTEMVTGLDLVELQLRLASGEKMDQACPLVKSSGHAIEFRICAEDPDTFFPSPGKILTYQEPRGDGIIVDSGFGAGDEVTPFYDSMMAKLVVHGETREAALGHAKKALGQYQIEGIRHNIPFHLRVLDEEEFMTGIYDTKFAENLGGKSK